MSWTATWLKYKQWEYFSFLSFWVFFFLEVSEELSEETSEHLVLEPGDVLKLRCDTNRPGAVHWFKGDIRVQHGGRIQIRAGVVEITDVTYEDSGVYVCMVRGTREALRNFTITVAGTFRHKTWQHYSLLVIVRFIYICLLLTLQMRWDPVMMMRMMVKKTQLQRQKMTKSTSPEVCVIINERQKSNANYISIKKIW